MSVTIGVLTSEHGRYSRFWMSLLGLEVLTDMNFNFQMSLNIADARNNVIRSSNAQWVWFIDDDHTFQPDLLSNLMKRNVDIIQPLVLTKNSPFGPVMMTKAVENKPGFYYRATLPEGGQKGLVPSLAVGAAGMLIKRSVLDAVGDPWFENAPGKINEDVNFCEKARAKGFKIWTDLDNVMGHLNVGEVKPSIIDGEWATEFTFGNHRMVLPTVKGTK